MDRETPDAATSHSSPQGWIPCLGLGAGWTGHSDADGGGQADDRGSYTEFHTASHACAYGNGNANDQADSQAIINGNTDAQADSQAITNGNTNAQADSQAITNGNTNAQADSHAYERGDLQQRLSRNSGL
jgi:hypothetical protein